MRNIKPKTEGSLMISGGIPKKQESKPVYPTMSLQHDSFPESKKMAVGKFHKVTLKLKKVGHSESRFQNSSEHEIHGIQVHGAKEEQGETVPDDEAKE